MTDRSLKIAVVHDWLPLIGGAEQVLRQILKAYPGADLYTLFDFLSDEERASLGIKNITVSNLNKLPGVKQYYRHLLPFLPQAVENFDLHKYNLVISSSHLVAKGVITGAHQVHVSYVHSPARYAWDMTHQYLNQAGLQKGPKGWLAKRLLYKFRIWDYRTPNGVDVFIANSRYIKRRIHKVYRRDANIIYPPVDIDRFSLRTQKEDFYLTASRMVPYKRIDLIAEAFAGMKDRKLVIIGDGPEMPKVAALAENASNITLMGYQSGDVLIDHMRRAKAFVFAAEEDFGIVPVEAQACGTPVIAYGAGGALETVIDLEASRTLPRQCRKIFTGRISSALKRNRQSGPGRSGKRHPALMMSRLAKLSQHQASRSLSVMGLRGTTLVAKFALTLFIPRYMGFDALGLYGLIMAATIMAPGFLGLGLMYTLSRKAVTQSNNEIAHDLSHYFHYISLAYTAFLIGTLIIGNMVDQLFFCLLVLAVVLFEHLNNELYQLLLNLSRPFLANAIHFLRAATPALMFMALALSFPTFQNIETLLTFWLFCSALGFAVFLWMARDWPWQCPGTLRQLFSWIAGEFREARTMYATNFARTLNQYLNHFLITIFLGLEITGIYVYFMQMISAMSNLLETGVIQFARPKLVRAHKEKDRAYWNIYKLCLKHSALTAIGMAALAAPGLYVITLYIVHKPESLEWFPVFIILLAQFIILTISETNRLVFYSQHRDDIILKLTMTTISIAIVLNVILVPLFGLWGAACVQLFMACFGLTLQRVQIKKLI